MSFSNLVNVANLPKDLQDRVKVALSDETKSDLDSQRVLQFETTRLLTELINEQKTTNKYLSEMLGDTITENEL